LKGKEGLQTTHHETKYALSTQRKIPSNKLLLVYNAKLIILEFKGGAKSGHISFLDVLSAVPPFLLRRDLLAV
jgi:hypothetical protein